MTNPPSRPPTHIKLPVSIAYAPVHEALIVTMARILGLCWAQGYRQSPPYAPHELAEHLGRSRTTLYSHLKELQKLQWLEVGHRNRRLVLQPLVRVKSRPPVSGPDLDSPQAGPPAPPEPRAKPQLCQALQEAGVSGLPLHELLRKNVDPIQVRAWHLWTRHPEQDWMRNRAGYIVKRLRDGDEPPAEFVDLARLAPEAWARIKQAWINSEQHRDWPSLSDELWEIAPLWLEVHEAMRRDR